MARILVIDDDKSIRRTVRLTLERAGHEVTTAEDGPTGLRSFTEGGRWDVVLVDERMPGMEGHTLVQELHHQDPDVSIIMETAYPSSDLASHVVEAGAADFLRKPFSTEMLRSAVTAALSHSQAPPSKPTWRPGTAASLLERAGKPLVSYYLNGHTYWPLPAGPLQMDLPPGFEVYRVYAVQPPMGEAQPCLVGVAPHVREQV